MSQVEKRLAELGLELPPAPKPAAAYVPAVRTGNLIFVSGQGPVRDGKAVYTGKVGGERTEEEGYEAARIAALILDWGASMIVAVTLFGVGVLRDGGWRAWMILAVFFVQTTVLTALTGSSFGQLLARIGIVRLDGQHLGWPRAAARSAACVSSAPSRSACPNARAMFFSFSPTHLDIRSDALLTTNGTPICPASHRPKAVLPVPGGPYRQSRPALDCTKPAATWPRSESAWIKAGS